MAGEWREVRLGEVVSINPDTLGSDWPFSYIKYIDISSVGEGPIVEPPRILHLDEAPSRAKRLVREGDTVLSTVRPSRRSMFFVKEPEPEWVVSTGFAVLRPCREYIEPRYLYACVFDRGFTEFLVKREKGAAYPAVLPEDIADAVIKLPPLPEQRAIAHILGTLDDKIELNRRMSQTLEAMARALFKAWFVDFEPVRAKMEGRWQRGQSLPGLPAHLYDLFPNRLVDSELGEIPEGWRVGTIGDCCIQIQNGGTPSRKEPRFWEGGTIPWLTSAEVKQPIIVDTENSITEAGLEASSAKWVAPLSTVVALYGATAGQVSLVALRLTTNQAVCALVPKQYCEFFNYLWMRSATPDLENQAVGSAQQNISQGVVARTRVLIPSHAVMVAFDKTVRPVFFRWISSLHESRTLAALRDALLPKLISGELRVKDVERFLEERGVC